MCALIVVGVLVGIGLFSWLIFSLQEEEMKANLKRNEELYKETMAWSKKIRENHAFISPPVPKNVPKVSTSASFRSSLSKSSGDSPPIHYDYSSITSSYDGGSYDSGGDCGGGSDGGGSCD